VKDSYAAQSVIAESCGGGLIGGGSATVVISSFWDSQICLPATSSLDGNSLPTPDMKSEDTYLAAGWDFVGETVNGTTEVWDMCDGMNYPRFVWDIVGGDVSCPDGVGIEDLQLLGQEWLGGSAVYCDIAPVGGDGKVDMLDFQELSKNWQRQ
jgi:hypothetical protein